MKIKICGMKQPENIQAVAALQPDMMGFIFYPRSPRYVQARTLLPVMDTLPSLIQTVGVFVNESPEQVIATTRMLGLDFVQLHGGESPAYCETLRQADLRIIKVFSVEKQTDLQGLAAFEDLASYFLFDTRSPQYGGSGRQFSWKILSNIKTRVPFFLSGGIGLEDAARLCQLNIPGLVGVDANSRLEKAPGLKDLTLAQPFIQNIRTSCHTPSIH